MDANAAESVCGKCGYIVRGLATLTCPECGSDLREVGIIRPDRPVRSSPFTRYLWPAILFLAWTTLCAALYVIFLIPYRQVIFGPFQSFGGLIDKEIWPYRGDCRRTLSYTPASGTSRKIILTETVTLRASGADDLYRSGMFEGFNASNYTRWEIDVELQTVKGASHHLVIDVAHGMTCRWTTGAGQQASPSAPLDRGLMLDWMRDAGLDISLATVQQEAAALLEVINGSATAGYWNAGWGSEDIDPVGRLGRVALHYEQQRRAAKLPKLWSDRSGSEQATMGPMFHINWLGIPVIVLVWAGGNWFGVRRFRAAARPAQPKAATGSRTMSVMFVDMIGYTARASLESRGGLLDLIRRKRALITAVLDRRHGHVVKTLGDGLLITFESATDAVLAGVEIQEKLAIQNRAATNEWETFELRIAISTGEVAHLDGDVYGEAVNLASRVQQLATAGDVVFTESTFAMLNKTEAPSERLGSFELKGVAGLVSLYRAVPERVASRGPAAR